MAKKIVFLDEYTVDKADLTPIKRLGDYTGYDLTGQEQVVERCKGAEIAITNKTKFTAEIIAALPDLRLICVAATGMNNIDVEAAEKAGISVRNAIGYSTYSVAEQTFSGVLALLKQILYFDRYVKDGGYASSSYLFDYTRPTYELHGRKWGIVGLGNIGKQVAKVAEAFGCDVAYHSTSGANNDKDYTRMPLDELLSWADIVSVHAPLSRQTRNLIDYHQLSLMKPSGIIVNVARGGIINEEGLARALNDGKIAGAAIDVYSSEPIAPDNPLMGVTDKYKLLLTPHSAWHTQEALQVLVGKVAENISNYIKETELK